MHLKNVETTKTSTPATHAQRMSVLAPLNPDLLAQIHAELDKIKRYNNNGDLIMTMESVGLTGDIRYAVLDGVPGLCRLDLVMVGANMTNKQALHWIEYNLADSETTNEVSEFFGNYKFKGRGQQMTRLLTVDQSITLLEKLPGPNGKRISDHIRKLGRRVVAGDQRMHDEIDANARNQSDVNVFARVATVLEAVDATGGATPENLQAIARLNEYESRLALLEARDQKLHAKIAKSERMKQLNDVKSAHKRQLALIEKETEAAIKKQRMLSELEIEMKIKREEAENRILEKRLPLLKQHDEIEEVKFQREMLRLEKQIQLKTATPATQVPALPPMPSGPFTARLVGDFYGIFKDVSTKFVIRISNSAMKNIMTHPHNIEPFGWVEDKLIGKRHAHFRSEDVPLLKKVLENCKMDEEKYENIKAAPQDIISSA